MHYIFLVLLLFLSTATTKENENYLSLIQYQAQIKTNELPQSIKIIKSVGKDFPTVIGYGKWLENNRTMHPDSVTIHSNEYWNAFVTMSMNSPEVYITRLYSMILTGDLSRLKYVLFFTRLHSDQQNLRQNTLLNSIQRNCSAIRDSSNSLVARGIKYHDTQKYRNALKEYDKALAVWSKNGFALYEVGFTNMFQDLEKNIGDMIEEKKTTHEHYYALARKHDPFQRVAYQGKKEIAAGMSSILNYIQPATKELTSGNYTPEAFGKFAKGCMELKEWELAAYALHFQLVMSVSEETGVPSEVLESLTTCLKNLGAEESADFIDSQYQTLHDALVGEHSLDDTLNETTPQS